MPSFIIITLYASPDLIRGGVEGWTGRGSFPFLPLLSESSVVESESLNILKSKLQRLHDIDESFLGNNCPIDSEGRASSPGEVSSGELSSE